MAALRDIVAFLDEELNTRGIADYPGALNGLQLSNRGEVRHAAAAVDFSSRVVNEAVARSVDLLILHHGMFWTGSKPLTGKSYGRMTLLFEHGIAVYGSHLPLD